MKDKNMDLVDARRENSDTSGNDFSIDILGVFNRRRLPLVLSCLIGIAAGVTYFCVVKPTYESSARILLMQNDSASMASQLRSAESGVSEDLLATHMGLLQSKRIVENALQTAALSELPSILNELGEDDTPTDYVIDNLYVTKGGDGSARDARILSLAFRHKSPEDAKLVVDAVLNEYKLFVKSKFNDINKEAVDLISKARLELESDIEKLSSEYREFRSNSPLLASTEGGANIFAIRYEELAAEQSALVTKIDQAKGRLELVKSQLTKINSSHAHQLSKLALIDELNAERLGILVTVERGEAATASFQALQPERIAGAQSEYTGLLTLRARLREMQDNFGEEHPEVKAIQSQIDEMNDFFQERESKLGVNTENATLTPDDVMDAYISLLENDLLALQQRNTDLENQISIAEEKAKTLVAYELQDREFTRSLARQEELYSSVVERLRDINMQQDTSNLIQEVIEEPGLGEMVSPNLPIAAAIVLLTSIFVACSSVLFLEVSDKRVHSAEDLESIYTSKVISHIPDFQKDKETRKIMANIASDEPVVVPAIVSYHAPKSHVSEAYRGIRTQILFKAKEGKLLIAVTSPKPGDGKSTTAANLAVTLANTGKSVLLIDCDMRRPNQAKLFGLDGTCGISNVLAGVCTLADASIAGPIPKLQILAEFRPPDNPAELLSHDSFTLLMQEARDRFDYVLLDCPPVLPVSDACIIAPLVDGVLLITSLDDDGVNSAKQCRKHLTAANANLYGIIVNRAPSSGSSYSYAGYGYKTY